MSADAMKAAARARSNIALVKYWGKAPGKLNVPAVGSISITLDALWSDTELIFDPAFAADEFMLDGKHRPDQLARISACLDILRDLAGIGARAAVVSRNNFPTGAGLASSASGFAALVSAAARALGLELAPRELSIVARRGSGSAARSIFGGFVEMRAGSAADGRDSYAEPLLAAAEWPLDVVVAVTATGEKEVASGSGMMRCAQSSPFYPAWLETHPADMALCREAIRSRDFEALAEIAEASCFKMHAAAMATRPALIYWNGVTLECIGRIRQLRKSGVPVFFTVDAGPQVKAVCAPGARGAVREALAELPGVVRIIESSLGPGVETRECNS
ncbi:diphosphomevalonate decarboxylase [Candidatus Rariloculus sp.]|uniref:diphosphomevalonate decarboxylase n=1 Tax=Candidatus Rariloculus sp. TaxID=3101265 RepID=UPI003D0E0773